MRVRPTVSSHPPVAFNQVVFWPRHPTPFDVSTTQAVETEVNVISIVVTHRASEQCLALAAISRCPNIRTLTVIQSNLRYRRDRKPDDPAPEWPTNFHLPHLHTLRLDPRLPPSFTAFLMLNCPNLQTLIVYSPLSPDTIPPYATPPVRLGGSVIALPALWKLDLREGALNWANKTIDLRTSRKIVEMKAVITLGDEMSQLVGVPSLPKLEVVVAASRNTVNRPYVFNLLLTRPTKLIHSRTSTALPSLPHLQKLVLSNITEDAQHALLDNESPLRASLRVLQLNLGWNIDALINSASRWPRTLRVVILQSHRGAERPSQVTIKRLLDLCRARRVVLQRKWLG